MKGEGKMSEPITSRFFESIEKAKTPAHIFQRDIYLNRKKHFELKSIVNRLDELSSKLVALGASK